MSFPERAGWYDDPEDDTQLRYFDGVVWSDHRVPRQTRSAQPVDPAPQQGGQYAQASGPGRDVFGRPSAQGQTQAPQQPGWGTSPAGPTTADGQPLASFGTRATAYLIDTVIMGVLVLLTSGWAWWLFMADYWRRAMEGTMSGTPDPVTFEEASSYLQYLDYEYLFIAVAIMVLVQAVYGIGFLVARGATPGKMMAGIHVRGVHHPGPLGFGTAFMRMLLPMILRVLWVLTCMVEVVFRALDLLWPLKDARRQALHDKIAGTQVVVGKQPRERS
ncbi:RDD family protein [Janibacter cremeus]|uniref:Putative RDD family membrane protein YckC n=1 Tax=Janibacter cremeus TaxID=1285192 RepID=A0A852VQE9_9MICO|nr:RDD family protein [Janibacter cremeus]NYF99182.1 putative RDD family membrane protein YckC [Janibacter cremeus]